MRKAEGTALLKMKAGIDIEWVYQISDTVYINEPHAMCIRAMPIIKGLSNIILEQKRKRCHYHWAHRESNLLFTLKRQQQQLQKSKRKSLL